VSGQLYATAVLLPEKEPLVPTVYWVGLRHSENKISFELGSIDRPDHVCNGILNKHHIDFVAFHCVSLRSSGQGPVEGSCEHGNGTSGSIKFWEVLE
jgi:hypothetical protein